MTESLRAEQTVEHDGQTIRLRATWGAMINIETATGKPIPQLVQNGLASVLGLADVSVCVFELGRAAGADFKTQKKDIAPLLEHFGASRLIPAILNCLLDGWNGAEDEAEEDPTEPATMEAGSNGASSTGTP